MSTGGLCGTVTGTRDRSAIASEQAINRLSPLSRGSGKSRSGLAGFPSEQGINLGLIRRLTSLIRKLDRVGKSPRADPDLHCGYHACADFLGLDSYHAASDSRDHFRTELL